MCFSLSFPLHLNYDPCVQLPVRGIDEVVYKRPSHVVRRAEIAKTGRFKGLFQEGALFSAEPKRDHTRFVYTFVLRWWVPGRGILLRPSGNDLRDALFGEAELSTDRFVSVVFHHCQNRSLANCWFACAPPPTLAFWQTKDAGTVTNGSW